MAQTQIVSESTGEILFYSPDTYLTDVPGQALKMPNDVVYRVVTQVGHKVYVQPADVDC